MSGQQKYLTGKSLYKSLHVPASLCEQGIKKSKSNLKILCLVYFYPLCSRTDSAKSTRNTFTKPLAQKSLPLSFFINYFYWTRNFWKHEDIHSYAHNLENCKDVHVASKATMYHKGISVCHRAAAVYRAIMATSTDVSMTRLSLQLCSNLT